uniref:Uncharacterized protein n=1 Tax=Rhizophora mucronata TaxID=61149 RepID=A0A2P2N7T6_RHIMU
MVKSTGTHLNFVFKICRHHCCKDRINIKQVVEFLSWSLL